MLHLPSGHHFGEYGGRRYGLTVSVHNDGRSRKLYAEELGGADFVSLNVYHTSAGVRLKPCEMPAEKVIAFVEGVVLD